ncbi:DUF4177 domain-containing protein [Microbulbifer halophilus]|uniref:DUF4177 domain-containing protein n=1 Tax=Microbulbifer halophilus TaxID=453963 RepID=A0ABW5ECJ2_9GAMM|nr:DUF4177 domain-containing protein [Microbulbifer halophilus]MCW8126665.1 hypothetical protein [Microbulbifer halophilus]
MQKIVEFRKRSFWHSQVDLTALNEKIVELNRDGWRVEQVVNNTNLVGQVMSCTLLLERDE